MNGIDQAIEALKAGRAVVFPTDTVYGLGVAVEHAPGPQEIYELKRRDSGKPVAWLVDGVRDLQRYGLSVPDEAVELAQRHWPGALTLVVKASAAVPAAFAPDGTIGLRAPAGDVARMLIRAVGPIATSSANRSGGPASRAFEDLDSRLLREVACAVRADLPASGVASTVVDATQPTLRVLRQGDIGAAEPRLHLRGMVD